MGRLPSTVTSNQTNPLCATVSCRCDGSVTIAASARKRSTTSSVPKLAYSSSATQATRMSPATPSPWRDGRDHHRRDPAFHVEGAAPEHLAVGDPRDERIAIVARQRHRIDMPVEHERPSAACTAHHADDARPPRMALQPMRLQPMGFEPAGDIIRDGRFAAAARHEVRIDGRDGDELREQRCRIQRECVGHARISSGVAPTICGRGRGRWLPRC